MVTRIAGVIVRYPILEFLVWNMLLGMDMLQAEFDGGWAVEALANYFYGPATGTAQFARIGLLLTFLHGLLLLAMAWRYRHAVLPQAIAFAFSIALIPFLPFLAFILFLMVQIVILAIKIPLATMLQVLSP